jgi:S1-C subfamily serine protease
VRILSVAIDPFKVIERVQLGVGTGFVIDDDGHIVTNAHVVYGASELIVSNGKEQMAKAEIVGVDPISDLAVIKLATSDMPLRSAGLGSSKELAIGEEVLAIGYPLGISKTATRGIISAMERVVPLSPFSWMMPFIQTDAAISPGNSGGPLVNRCGEIIGVNTLYAEMGQNINFATPIDLVRELVPQMIENGRVSRPWHGINGRIVPRELMFILGLVPGFLVETIEPGSPAEKINLHGGTFRVVIGVEEYLLGGDVITKLNGEQLTDMETVARIARSLRVGDKVTLEYWRRGKLDTAEVILPERPILPGDVMRFHERRRPR